MEISVPYLPGDRFTILFENLYGAPAEVNFSDDHTEANYQFTLNEYKSNIKLRGGPDFMDLEAEMVNTCDRELPSTFQFCFQPTGAPHFRDHDGHRTFVMTDQGFIPVKKLWTPLSDRNWLQDFQFDFSPAEGHPAVKGPMIAIVSRDRQWIVSVSTLSSKVRSIFNNREYSCIHSIPESALKPGESIQIRQRYYFIRGTLDDFEQRRQEDSAGNFSQ